MVLFFFYRELDDQADLGELLFMAADLGGPHDESHGFWRVSTLPAPGGDSGNSTKD